MYVMYAGRVHAAYAVCALRCGMCAPPRAVCLCALVRCLCGAARYVSGGAAVPGPPLPPFGWVRFAHEIAAYDMR